MLSTDRPGKTRLPHVFQTIGHTGIGGVLLVVLFLSAYALNDAVPLFADDYSRAIAPDVNPLAAAWHRSTFDYFNWTGRFVVSMVTCLLVGTHPIEGSLLFAALNAAMYVALVHGIARMATQGRGSLIPAPYLLVATALAVFVLPQSIGESALWKTGALNYLWVLVAALWFMAPFVRLLDPTYRGSWKVIGYLLPGAYLALGLENLSLSVLVVCTGLMAWRLLQDRRLGAIGHHLPLIAIYAALVAMLVLAPGNFVRMSYMPEQPPLLERAPQIVRNLIGFARTDWMLGLLLLGSACLRPRNLRDGVFIAFLSLGALSLLAMSLVPAVGLNNRTVFASEIALIAAAMRLVFLYVDATPRRRLATPALAVATAGMLCVHGLAYADAYRTQRTIDATYQDRLSLMSIAKQRDWNSVLLPRYEPLQYGQTELVRGPLFVRDLSTSPDGERWLNDDFEHKTGVRPVLSEATDVRLKSSMAELFASGMGNAVTLRGSSLYYRVPRDCDGFEGTLFYEFEGSRTASSRKTMWQPAASQVVDVVDDRTGEREADSCVFKAELPAESKPWTAISAGIGPTGSGHAWTTRIPASAR